MPAVPPAGIRIRDCRPEDLPKLCEIDAACFPAGVAYDEEHMREFLKRGTAFALAAETPGGETAAFAIGHKTHRFVGHIVTVDVLRPFRRQGVGERLMRAVEERLAAHGARRIRLETAKDNRAAIALFEKLGYRRTGEAANYYADGSDAWLLELRLR